MGARIIAYGTGTFSLFGEVYYTLAQTTEEPLAADQVPVFEGLRDSLKTLLLQEVDFLEQRAKAQATVDRADDKLDRFVSKVLRAVDEHTDGNTRKQLRKKLLKGKSPSKLTRPVLGRQIQDTADWSAKAAEAAEAAEIEAAALEAQAAALLKKAASLKANK
jgi:hypothetical protein